MAASKATQRLRPAEVPVNTRPRRSGIILSIASTAAFQPGPYMSMYYATKADVLSFTEGTSHEFDGTGVTATAPCLGATKTECAVSPHYYPYRLRAVGLPWDIWPRRQPLTPT